VRIDVAVRPTTAVGRFPAWLLGLPAIALVVIGAALPLIGADSLDAFMTSRGWRASEKRGPALQAWIGAITKPSVDLPVLRFDVKFKSWKKLLDKRAFALAEGRLDASNKDFVGGELRFGGRTMAVKLRLQGDDVRALAGSKWPIRVRVRGGDHVLGVERFTLKSPIGDGLYDKQFLYGAMREAGVMAPRYRFVVVEVNGKDFGTFALEEYLSKELVADNRRPPGPLLRIVAALPADSSATSDDDAIGYVDPRLLKAKVHRAGRWRDEPLRRAKSKRGRQLLDGLLDGSIAVDDAVDTHTTGRFLAVVKAFGVEPLVRWDNMRWYYNIAIDRLEPVAYSSGPVDLDRTGSRPMRRPLPHHLLSSPATRRAAAQTVPRDVPITRLLRDEFPMAVPRERKKREVKAAEPGPGSEPPVNISIERILKRDPVWPKRACIVVPAGTWTIERPIRPPPGSCLVVEPGATMKFQDRGALIIRGAATLIGSRDRLIRLRFGWRTGPTAPRGLVISRGGLVAAHVGFTGGESAVGRPPLVVHESRAELSNVVFKNWPGSAALEAVRATIELDDCVFVSGKGDGIAIAYGRDSRIQDTRLSDIAGDAIDVRGATGLRITGTYVDKVGDKGVSIGEGSTVGIDAMVIAGAAVGLAIKDGSRVTLRNIKMVDIAHTGLAAYAKKPRFGSPKVAAESCTIVARDKAILSHGDSEVRVDGKLQPTEKAPLARIIKLGWLGG